MVNGLLLVNIHSGWLQIKNGGGIPRRKTVVSFIWRTTALGYRRRTTVVGFKWRTLVVNGLQQVNNKSGWLQMKNGGGFPLKTTVVSFRWRTRALGYRRRTTVVKFKWRKICRRLIITVVGFK